MLESLNRRINNTVAAIIAIIHFLARLNIEVEPSIIAKTIKVEYTINKTFFKLALLLVLYTKSKYTMVSITPNPISRIGVNLFFEKKFFSFNQAISVR